MEARKCYTDAIALLSEGDIRSAPAVIGLAVLYAAEDVRQVRWVDPSSAL
jgi:hypothetical protein